jgi:peptidyl-prolyl cis-trans isomerase B (cyclophilin B)
VLQCGDPTGTGSGGPGYQFSVENAPADGRYPAGTLAMARATSPDSNGSQFFLTYADSTIPSPDGYTVFGHVTAGLDLLRRIGQAGVDPDNPPRPRVPVGITSVSVTQEDGS